ncbi:Tm-1-like ATP-binding domain-containing protein [Serratia microhaemolytica]|uniref:Tm-1-like ATP-binding domain-containing protein n=1 Tax=Serratia microhaemolytica TaxID=2675110 RepID=UPI000FDDD3DC|nr:Tm-1-like ATP-binding domain-containing protein [Serratia microhaemolytica]
MAKLVYVIRNADSKLEVLLWRKLFLHAARVGFHVADTLTDTFTLNNKNNLLSYFLAQLIRGHMAKPAAVDSQASGNSATVVSVALTHLLVSAEDDISGLISFYDVEGTRLIRAAMLSMPIGVRKVESKTVVNAVENYTDGVDRLPMLSVITLFHTLNLLSCTILAYVINRVAGYLNPAMTLPQPIIPC